MSDQRLRDATDGDATPERATIGDVASRAGVSVATVSRALRGLPNVAATTRERIVLAAEELRYRPDPAAARLAAGRTSTVTIGVPSLATWYFSNAVAGAEAVCAEAGYEVQVVCLDTPADVARLVDPTTRLERRTDALLLVDIDLRGEDAVGLEARGVVIGTIGFHVPGCAAVQIDDAQVGSLAADHLVEIGCRRPAMLVGLPDYTVALRVPGLRRSGFEARLRERAPDLRPVVETAPFGIAGGRAAMSALLDGPEPPDGVFAMSDEMAFGALMELRARNVRVGVGDDAVALLGVDDHEFSTVVELSSIRQDVPALGGTIAARVIAEMTAEPGADQHDDEIVRAPVHMVQRASTRRVDRR